MPAPGWHEILTLAAIFLPAIIAIVFFIELYLNTRPKKWQASYQAAHEVQRLGGW